MMQRACAVRMMKKPMFIRIQQIKIFYHIFAPCTSIAQRKSLPTSPAAVRHMNSCRIILLFQESTLLISHLIQGSEITDCRIQSVKILQEIPCLFRIITEIIVYNRACVRNQNRHCGLPVFISNILVCVCNDNTVLLTIFISHRSTSLSDLSLSILI